MQRWLTIFYALLFLLSGDSEASADSLDDLLVAAGQMNLAQHPVWLKLLHYERNGDSSEVITEPFFLSPQGQDDPAFEMSATLAAYFAPWGKDTDSHARCEYPARYFWLAQHLPLPDYTIRDTRCARLEKWALFDRVNSISLLLVSGYFGNPASTFGHALLKLNTDSSDDLAGLFDLTINFGALVPEDEATLLYVARGLFGGYDAGFSDRYFYTQDLVYLRTEFRDVWDYQLNLSDYERTLLVLHIWEIIGKKFRYYFLDDNCAYRLGELLDLVLEEELLENARIWYIPVELFHRINQIDVERRGAGEKGLVNSLKFIPSSQRTLFHQFSRLQSEEAEVANSIILQGTANVSEQLKAFPPDRQTEIVDAVLAYHQYRLVAEEPSPSAEHRNAKDQALLVRLRLPPNLEPPRKVPALPSPAQGGRPLLTAMGFASDTNGYAHWQLRWAPFSQELVSRNSLEGGELVVLDTTIGIAQGGDQAFVEQLDFLRVRKLNTSPVEVAGESRWSWQLYFGGKRQEDNNTKRTDGVMSYGAGRAWQWKDDVSFYAMTDVAVHTLSPFLRVRPHVGLISGIGALRFWMYIGAESASNDPGFRDVWGGKLQYHFSAQQAIRAEFSNENDKQVSTLLVWYW